MASKFLSPKNAAALDQDLMSSQGGFSIDQLMELAGLSVSQAVYKVYPPSRARRVLIACGPGNNGGDGLVAARHLWHYGYKPSIYYPKQGKCDIYQRLTKQLHNLNVPFVDDFDTALKDTDQIVDAIFAVIRSLESTQLPVTSIDAPSSWDIESGPPTAPSGDAADTTERVSKNDDADDQDGTRTDEGPPGAKFMPSVLVSLTAPKPLVRFLRKDTRHFLGGRFVTPDIAQKYDLELPAYQGIEQVIEWNLHR